MRVGAGEEARRDGDEPRCFAEEARRDGDEPRCFGEYAGESAGELADDRFCARRRGGMRHPDEASGSG